VVIAVVPEASDAVLTGGGEIEPLFRAHYTRLVRALAVVCGDGEVAADAVQEAFVRAHVRWRRLRHYDDPVGWIRRVALNLVRDDHRRALRKRRAVARLAAEPAASGGEPEPDTLTAMLATLPHQQRVAVALYYVEGLSIAEVATTMELAEGTVKSHLHDARLHLRNIIESEGD
jgi:RNA polymerase sigma-70 factor (ECF subfamily)